jgi:threonine dehydrogenase-like Zn-dependent dehydrogenase|tara:strand:- start:3226 stop:4299 length:1074 start_codon:yes stop_codon:yes gene_type:complete
MQAIVLHGKNDLRYVTDYPKPTPGPGEVLLKMTYSSICQTDIEVWQHGMFDWSGTPHIQGHEAAGIVVEIGPALEEDNPDSRRGSKLPKSTLEIGTRVAVENVRTCGTCFFCRKGTSQLCENGRNFGFSDDGGLAEFGVWPAALCIPLPDNVTNEEAPLAEPTSVAVHAVENANVTVGEIAAVIGCGVVGLCTLQVLKAAGINVIAIDPREQSLKLARELGAIETLNPNDVDPAELLPVLTNGYGPDVIIETAGAPGTGLDAANWVRRGGRVVIVGFSHEDATLNFGRAHMAEKTIIGSSATSTGGYQKAVNLIANGSVNVKPLISALVPLDKGIEDGFERMLKPEKDVYRILVGNG